MSHSRTGVFLLVISGLILMLCVVLFPFIRFGALLLADPGTFATSPDDGELERLLERIGEFTGDVEYVSELQPSETLLPDKTHLIHVNGEPANLYEYASVESRDETIGRISADGSAIRFPPIYGWIVGRGSASFNPLDKPLFFKHSRFIIAYYDDDPTVLQILRESFGPPFAGSISIEE